MPEYLKPEETHILNFIYENINLRNLASGTSETAKNGLIYRNKGIFLKLYLPIFYLNFFSIPNIDSSIIFLLETLINSKISANVLFPFALRPRTG